ncbi:hypothetical protein L1889_17395 [Paenalcaligenes niemegkensis]|uniref:hypothetical protein n=1 Tax=Paenalcaligenes niemegkensis TaxID=2895469 RepID=UPI001EE7F854|nr:hypothetical protein [Paenalcaligenes niemegkensis]MCQ9618231.1 hypothetical protein [Paenalcaligenes niemegkensis]
MRHLIESLDEYLTANARMAELMHMNPDTDTLEYKMLSVLTDQVFIYEIRNFPVFYENSQYFTALRQSSANVDDILEELELV